MEELHWSAWSLTSSKLVQHNLHWGKSEIFCKTYVLEWRLLWQYDRANNVCNETLLNHIWMQYWRAHILFSFQHIFGKVLWTQRKFYPSLSTVTFKSSDVDLLLFQVFPFKPFDSVSFRSITSTFRYLSIHVNAKEIMLKMTIANYRAKRNEFEANLTA